METQEKDHRRRVGAWIRVRRDELGLSASALARAAGVARGTVLSAETGMREPRDKDALENALHWHKGSLSRAYDEGIRPQAMQGQAPGPRLAVVPSEKTEPTEFVDIHNPDGTTNLLALAIQGRIRELAQQRDEPQMTLAQLARKAGLNATTTFQYAKGNIRGSRLTPSVIDKLHKIAIALEMPVEVLIEAARESKYDKEMQLVQLWRKLRTDEDRERALHVLEALVHVSDAPHR